MRKESESRGIESSVPALEDDCRKPRGPGSEGALKVLVAEPSGGEPLVRAQTCLPAEVRSVAAQRAPVDEVVTLWAVGATRSVTTCRKRGLRGADTALWT